MPRRALQSASRRCNVAEAWSRDAITPINERRAQPLSPIAGPSNTNIIIQPTTHLDLITNTNDSNFTNLTHYNTLNNRESTLIFHRTNISILIVFSAWILVCSTAMCIAAVICVMRLFSMMIAALCANIRVPMSIMHSGFFRLENNVFLFPLRFFLRMHILWQQSIHARYSWVLHKRTTFYASCFRGKYSKLNNMLFMCNNLS